MSLAASTPAVAPARRAVLAAAVLVGLAGLAAGILAAPISYDDAWITYRYAYNVAAGQGFVYNPGEHVFGTSAPGYALLLGVLSRPNPEWVPTVSAVLCAISLAACGAAFATFGAVRGSTLAGVVAGLVFVTNPLALEAFSGEMVPQAALALWAVTALAVDRPALATTCGVAATLIRPDGLLVLLVVLGAQVGQARRVPWMRVGVAVAVLAVWFGGLWIWLGTPLPHTLAAKQAQRLSGLWRALGADMAYWLRSLTIWPSAYMPPRPQPGFSAFLGLAVAGLALLPWRRRWLLWAAWPVIAMVVYRQLRLPFFHWYLVPPLALLALGAGLAADGIASALGAVADRFTSSEPAGRSRRSTLIAGVVGVALLIATALPMARTAWRQRAAYPSPVERAYVGVGEWLARETPPAATVGYLEVGFIGYYSRRHIVDPLGLVSPHAVEAIARRDFLETYRIRRPDVILHQPAFFPEYLGLIVDQPWFKAEYRAVATLPSARPQPITVYRRIAPGLSSKP
jgi:hypothetical protein